MKTLHMFIMVSSLCKQGIWWLVDRVATLDSSSALVLTLFILLQIKFDLIFMESACI